MLEWMNLPALSTKKRIDDMKIKRERENFFVDLLMGGESDGSALFNYYKQNPDDLSYVFSYDTGWSRGGRSYRFEEGDGKGGVKGEYGWIGERGAVARITRYTAGTAGYRSNQYIRRLSAESTNRKSEGSSRIPFKIDFSSNHVQKTTTRATTTSTTVKSMEEIESKTKTKLNSETKTTTTTRMKPNKLRLKSKTETPFQNAITKPTTPKTTSKSTPTTTTPTTTTLTSTATTTTTTTTITTAAPLTKKTTTTTKAPTTTKVTKTATPSYPVKSESTTTTTVLPTYFNPQELLQQQTGLLIVGPIPPFLRQGHRQQFPDAAVNTGPTREEVSRTGSNFLSRTINN